MLKIYGIKNCNSMKKAFDALQAKGLSYEFHDYKKQGIDADTLKIWLKEIGQDTVLNKKGTSDSLPNPNTSNWWDLPV
ncbi:hypothetical protein OPU39_03495, partial [Acinetobacter nosocomialis]|nr:hypothetical protein [Acinetobacter nosocomialis]